MLETKRWILHPWEELYVYAKELQGAMAEYKMMIKSNSATDQNCRVFFILKKSMI